MEDERLVEDRKYEEILKTHAMNAIRATVETVLAIECPRMTAEDRRAWFRINILPQITALLED